MFSIKHWVLVSLISVSAVCIASDLSNYRAEISAVRHGTIDLKAKGNINFSMSPDKDWSLSINLKGGPLKSTEFSNGEFVDGDFRPIEYERRTKVFFVKENIDWDFDWTAKRLKGKVKKDTRAYELDDIIHDPLSFQLPMRKALIEGQSNLTFNYLRYNRPEQLSFEIIGEELLSLETGRVHTIILKQTKPLRSGQKKLIWVAKNHDFIPVRFTTHKDNKLKDEIVVKKLWINDDIVAFEP